MPIDKRPILAGHCHLNMLNKNVEYTEILTHPAPIRFNRNDVYEQ